jgi:hypothetical protein
MDEEVTKIKEVVRDQTEESEESSKRFEPVIKQADVQFPKLQRQSTVKKPLPPDIKTEPEITVRGNKTDSEILLRMSKVDADSDKVKSLAVILKNKWLND